MIDVLVNNAGVYTIDPLEVSSDGAIENVARTNIEGIMRVTRAVNSRSGRLRYTTDFLTRGAILLHRLLPLGLFQWLVAKVSGVR